MYLDSECTVRNKSRPWWGMIVRMKKNGENFVQQARILRKTGNRNTKN